MTFRYSSFGHMRAVRSLPIDTYQPLCLRTTVSSYPLSGFSPLCSRNGVQLARAQREPVYS